MKVYDNAECRVYESVSSVGVYRKVFILSLVVEE